MSRVADPIRLRKVSVLDTCPLSTDMSPYVDAPTERRRARSYHWVLIDCDDLFVLQDGQVGLADV